MSLVNIFSVAQRTGSAAGSVWTTSVFESTSGRECSEVLLRTVTRRRRVGGWQTRRAETLQHRLTFLLSLDPSGLGVSDLVLAELEQSVLVAGPL